MNDQNLDIYFDEDFTKILETWGLDNAWNEVQLLLSNHQGKVLDIACGTGKVIEILSRFKNLDLYGCDISDMLIWTAVKRGIPGSKLAVCDATSLPYSDNEFEYCYSIGSIEHFNEVGIVKFIEESHRTTRKISFHMLPVSKSGLDEGWKVTSDQSYFNNSVEWWIGKFNSIYDPVVVLDSVWEDDCSTGKWFICKKNKIV